MKVLIDADDRFTVLTGKAPAVGRHYVLEEAQNATSEQSRAFHALAQEFWTTGQHSYDCGNFDEFRNLIKRDLGAGFESYLYAFIDAEGNVQQRKVETYAEVPAEIRKSPRVAQMVYGKLKSWADYTKKQRTETIDSLIATMHQAGVNSPKFQEILAGMGADQ
jgi:hypothetical protein